MKKFKLLSLVLAAMFLLIACTSQNEPADMQDELELHISPILDDGSIDFNNVVFPPPSHGGRYTMSEWLVAETLEGFVDYADVVAVVYVEYVEVGERNIGIDTEYENLIMVPTSYFALRVIDVLKGDVLPGDMIATGVSGYIDPDTGEERQTDGFVPLIREGSVALLFLNTYMTQYHSGMGLNDLPFYITTGGSQGRFLFDQEGMLHGRSTFSWQGYVPGVVELEKLHYDDVIEKVSEISGEHRSLREQISFDNSLIVPEDVTADVSVYE